MIWVQMVIDVVGLSLGERHFRTADCMLSRIQMDVSGSLHMKLRTNSGERLMFDNGIFVRMLSSGNAPSSLVNTEETCLFTTLLLSLLPTANSPHVLSREANPSFHTRRWLTYL